MVIQNIVSQKQQWMGNSTKNTYLTRWGYNVEFHGAIMTDKNIVNEWRIQDVHKFYSCSPILCLFCQQNMIIW